MQTQTIAPPTRFESERARYEAVRRRDARADGQFFYGVITTGVYCRPSCAARLALRENVRFHATTEDAERAGFRPCKRCRPSEAPNAERERVLAAVRERLDTAGAPISLAELADGVNLSPYHLHRLFRKHVGMTPREYAAAVRLQRVGDELREGASVTRAIYEAGYSSSSRFYEEGSGALGIAPRQLRGGGDGVTLRSLLRSCSLGQVLIAATSRGICLIAFGDDADQLGTELRARFPRADLQAADGELEQLADRVVAMIDQSELAADLPLDLIGTAFQQRVWRALRDIPRGETRSYSQIAKQIGAPGAARAVGSACGKNPVAVVVPCHRVLRDDGAIGGYRWGLPRKRALLERERKR
jgi:AraC family transcriptional regulator, regulatory protein of adaptative response / methylated-DNA-[protein]-cysteine methyltransferase